MKKLFAKKSVFITATVLLSALLLLGILQLGAAVSSGWRAWSPEYSKEDITSIVYKEKDKLSDEDYDTLFRQTGLTRLGIDGLIDKNLRYRILEIQEQYFEEQSYAFHSFGPFTGFMKRSSDSPRVRYAVLENGDILYSASTFFSFFRLGHSSLVIDAAGAKIAQASGYGDPLKLLYTGAFFDRASFVILRVNADAETKNAVVDYAAENMLGLDYSILAGIFGKKNKENLKSTHCSHFIWYAYDKFGVDIDSNGGKIVTPDQILRSENVSVVQVYGIDPAKVIKN